MECEDLQKIVAYPESLLHTHQAPIIRKEEVRVLESFLASGQNRTLTRMSSVRRKGKGDTRKSLLNVLNVPFLDNAVEIFSFLKSQVENASSNTLKILFS